MTCKIKRRSLRCGGRPKADFGSLFTTFIAPALGVAGSVADSAISKTQISKSNIKPTVKETNTEVTNNTSVENLPTTQAPTKEPISGLVTSNTVIPPDPTKTPTMRLGGRKKCWIGAAIGAATSIAGSLFGAAAKKREMRRQKSIQDWQNTTQEAANMTTALNNSQDYQEDYLRQFRTAARLGKTLGAKGIYITDGGGATKIGNNTYLLRGGSHEDVNETGQTGIGINVGGNEVEAEGGEVAQKKNGALRIFSAQPILSNGMSPAQAILRGYNKDKVFSQQQAFKKRNHLSDDGGKAKHGTEVPYKRIHINEDGTFTDTLTGKNYNTSATNGEDVVITGKANHWKEAGKKDTSSYFDPMGAVNFVTAAGAPILNANPSNIVGSIRDSKNAGEFLKHYMMQDTGGFVNTKWAKEHPYLSLGINTIGDIGLGYGLGKTGVGLYRLRPSNLRKHIFENISPIGYDKPISRIKEAFKSALSGAEADIDNPSWFNNKSAQDLNTYNAGITKNMFGPHALEARFDAWRKYLGLPQKFNTWTESPIVKGAYTDTKGISNLKVLPKDQSVDFINSAGGNVANDIEEFTTRGYNGQKYGVSHIRDTWDLQPWSRLRGNIIEDKVIRPLYNTTIGKANRKLSSSLHKFINKYGYGNEAIQKYLNENGEEALDNLSDVIEYFADTKSIKGKLAHKLSGLDDIVNNKGYYVINKNSKLSKLTNKLSDKIKNFEASSLLPGAKPFKIAYDIPWTNEVFPNNEMVKGFNMIDNLPTEAYRYKLKNPLLDYKYRFGGRCKLRNGGLTSKDRGSSKHPYPSVSSKDFAGGGRTYPIPTKADAVDALRLAGLHGRSDVRSKVYSKYPSLRPKAAFGDWVRTNRDDNALADLLYESGLFDRESWNTMLRDIHEFTGMGGNPYNTDENVDAVMAPAFGSSSTRVLSQLSKSPEASYTLKQVLGLPTKEMVRKRIAGDIAKRIGVARAARQSNNFRNYNIARMQATNAEASFSPFANQVRYSEGKPVLVNTNGYYTTAENTISRNAKNMTSGANPFLYAPRTSDEVLEGLNRVITSAKQGAKNAGQRVGNNRAVREFRNLSNKDKAKYIGMAGFAATALPAVSIYLGNKLVGKDNKSTPVQKDAHGKPISQYIARPQAQQPSRPQGKKVTSTQKSVVVPKQVNKTVPQYKGNTTKGNYQLHDGETRTINGIKYTRRGNAIINHKTNVAYIYDKNGNYTGKADYSKVGNFNQAFDLARAAGRKDFIYRAGKYNNYSTIKETNAKKERLNRIVGARRVAKALGGCSRPVKGMRPKADTGIFVPYNKRYTSIYDAPDYNSDYNGGNVLGNGEVTVTAKRIKPTFMKPNNDAMNIINHPANETPYIPQRHNRSRTIFSGGDYLGLGIDTLAALSTGLVNYNTAGKYVLPDRAPIIQASKLPTTYNVNPEIEEVKRYRDRLTGQTFNNTSSSVAALNRSGAINLDALSNLSKLWATKENEENKMLTEDAKNQQTVAAQNVQNELARQSEIARIKNEANQAKGDALNVGLSGLSQAWTNFWTAGRTAYEDDQSRRAMIASSKEATPTRLSELDFDLSPDILAALYRTAKDDRTKRFYLSRLSPKQRQKYGIN